MAKKPRLGKCVHCLKDGALVTDEHVFPKSWYPNTTPAGIEKWKIPACVQCNNDYSKIENDLLLRLGLCIDPKALGISGVVPKALRSINPQYAENERDARHRAAKRKQLLKQLRKGNDFPSDAIYPNLGEKWGRPLEEQVIVPFSASSLHQLGRKIVRGIFYVEDHKFIEPPYIIEIFVVHDARDLQAISALDKFGKVYAREPGIVVCRALAADAISSLFTIDIWQQVKMYASVYEQR